MTQQPGWAQLGTDLFSITRRRPRPAPVDPGSRHLRDETIGDKWAADLVASIATEIRTWREYRGLSGHQLAMRCESLGYPIPRTIIANLESGRRGTISVAEILILSMALNVPPGVLVFPLGREEKMDVSPRRKIAPWRALRWLAGHWRPHTGMLGQNGDESASDALREWEEAQEIVLMYQRHDTLVSRYIEARDDTIAALRRLAEPPSPSLSGIRVRQDQLARRVNDAAKILRKFRNDMNDWGYVPTPIPADLEAEIAVL